MAEEVGTRRDGVLLDAINPADGTTCKVQISHGRMLAVASRSMGHAKDCGVLVPAALQKPTAIFEGLRWDDDEDPRGVGWRCYSAVPTVAHRADGSERPPWPAQVFVVFVNDEKIAYNWRWEKADPSDPQLPVGHAERFKKRLI